MSWVGVFALRSPKFHIGMSPAFSSFCRLKISRDLRSVQTVTAPKPLLLIRLPKAPDLHQYWLGGWLGKRFAEATRTVAT